MSNFDFYTGYWQKEVEKESKAKLLSLKIYLSAFKVHLNLRTQPGLFTPHF